MIAAVFGQASGEAVPPPWCQPICLSAHLAAHFEALQKVSCMVLSLFGARHFSWFPGSLGVLGLWLIQAWTHVDVGQVCSEATTLLVLVASGSFWPASVGVARTGNAQM